MIDVASTELLIMKERRKKDGRCLGCEIYGSLVGGGDGVSHMIKKERSLEANWYRDTCSPTFHVYAVCTQ